MSGFVWLVKMLVGLLNLWLSAVNWSELFKISSGLLTPLIAAIAAHIAYQQWKTNDLQRRLALFEKRLAVFDATMNMLASVLREANAELEHCFRFLKETRDHEFLFGPEVGAFIDEVYRRAVELHTHLVTTPQGGERLTEILDWFSGRMGEARQVFKKYMDFTQP